ncbi:hypothetical protein PQX77_010850 [Marasmius sp. AFHP31]|nr:hypothetical protein PQX77_010850 [Marasmius sp. AFHP31]
MTDGIQDWQLGPRDELNEASVNGKMYPGANYRMLVSKDIKQYLARRSLIFVPTSAVLKKAFDMMDFNDSSARRYEDRKRFEDFGSGPWEYTIMPGRWERKTYKPEYLPHLYHHSPDGTVTPLHFDNCHFNDLPRFTSTVHPLIVILFLKMRLPDIFGVPPSIREHAIMPLIEICGRWPCWLHNRFVPLPTSPKRKHSDNSSAPDFDVESNTSDLYFTSEDLVASWQRKLEKDASIHQPPDTDGAVVEYAQETVLSPEDVSRQLKEEDDKRWVLAKPAMSLHRAKWRR